MAIAYNTNIVRNGLAYYLDAANIKSYSGSGSTMTDLCTMSSTATLNGTYSYSNGRIRIDNSSVTAINNISHIQLPSITNITTVSLWYYVHSAAGGSRYLLDMRTGGAGGWIYSSGYGSNWASGTVYMNGGSAQSLSWAAIEPSMGVWRNVTVIASVPATDDMNLFSRYSDTEGYDVTFGSALIYNRVITEAENLANFNAMRGRYGI